LVTVLNLLLGPPPFDPFPAVVGITVHLTFAERAYELAGWYRRHGAKVILGGLHVLSCPEEVAPHADALVVGEGVQVWPEVNILGSRPDYLRELCRALRPLEAIRSAAATIDVTDDPSLIREMALAGCTGGVVGFESLAGENLVDANKKTPSPNEYARRVAILHDHGIQVYYKRSNRLWHLLIKHRLTGPVWRPLVECTRRRHLKFRRRLAAVSTTERNMAGSVVSAGV
jgi:radical SAM superfamily enzyme YgiQ (UPF0313 family)